MSIDKDEMIIFFEAVIQIAPHNPEFDKLKK